MRASAIAATLAFLVIAARCDGKRIVSAVDGPRETKMIVEDSSFWERVLQADSSLSSTPPPTLAPTSPPTPTPAPSPTPPPIPSPAPAPTPPPTPAPTPPLTASPTPPPTPSPIPPVTLTPTFTPTPPPTPPPLPPPTPSPTTPPTLPTPSPTSSPDCTIELNLDCVDEIGLQCEALRPQAVICEQGLSELVMRFNGGDCAQSVNIQPSALFQCMDLLEPEGAGPPPSEGVVYIQAQALAGSEFYFEGEVAIGSNFSMTPKDSDMLSADSTILVREGSANGRPMQLVNFHTSCSNNLFLSDSFGASQVIEFTNEEQGTVNSKTNVTYRYVIQNTGEVDAELVSLTTFVDPPGVTEDLTDQVENQIVGSSGNFTVNITVEIDLTVATRYTVEAKIVGKVVGGEKLCEDEETITFVAGGDGNLPDDTPGPTASPAPTLDTGGQTCEIQASAECALENDAPCDLLSPIDPAQVNCVLPDGPTQLGFIYRGGDCASSTTSQDFDCEDFNGGPSDETPLVNILVTNREGQDLSISTGVTVGTPIVLPDSVDSADLDGELSFIIYTGLDETDGVLQIMNGINAGCEEGVDFALGTTFGAVELSTYRDDETFVQGQQDVEWRYSVENIGFPALVLTEVTSDTNGEVFTQTPNIPLSMGENFSFSVPSEISLVSSGSYSGTLEATATTPTADDAQCNARASSAIVIE